MTQRPVQWRVFDLSDASQPSDDWSWSLLAIDQCGRVLQHVFGQNPGDLQRFNALTDEVLGWQSNRPQTFDILFIHQEEDNGTFPNLPLQADCHGTSNDFRILCVHSDAHSDGLAIQPPRSHTTYPSSASSGRGGELQPRSSCN